ATELAADSHAQSVCRQTRAPGRIPFPGWRAASAGGGRAARPQLGARPDGSAWIPGGIPRARTSLPVRISSGPFRRLFQPDRRFVEAACRSEEADQEAQVAATGDGARQPRPDQFMELGEMVAGHFREQVMLKMIILVQQKEPDNAIG